MDTDHAQLYQAAVGALSLLIAALGFFIARDFSLRDTKEKEVKAELRVLTNRVDEHGKKIAVFEQTTNSALAEISQAATERATILAKLAAIAATIEALHRELDQLRQDGIERRRVPRG